MNQIEKINWKKKFCEEILNLNFVSKMNHYVIEETVHEMLKMFIESGKKHILFVDGVAAGGKTTFLNVYDKLPRIKSYCSDYAEFVQLTGKKGDFVAYSEHYMRLYNQAISDLKNDVINVAIMDRHHGPTNELYRCIMDSYKIYAKGEEPKKNLKEIFINMLMQSFENYEPLIKLKMDDSDINYHIMHVDIKTKDIETLVKRMINRANGLDRLDEDYCYLQIIGFYFLYCNHAKFFKNAELLRCDINFNKVY